MPDIGTRLPLLRSWTVSGEALPQTLVERFFERLPDRLLLNLYGSSEVSADVTAHEFLSSADAVAIGTPIANTRVLVLDSHGHLLPHGAIGELYVGGAGLARGYVDDPRLTAERFVPDPFGPPGARLYRTGDLGRLRADAALLHLGRRDQQVKIRGCRVELGEIEAALLQHPSVTAAAVRLHGERLIAYVVTTLGLDRELRGFLAERLPDFMLPAAFVRLEALPRTATGKLDRRALAPPSQDTAPTHAPRTDLERAIAAIWAETLGPTGVGLHDNFFDVGGNSLLAMRIHARMAAELAPDVQLLDLFRFPTVGALAAHLSQTVSATRPRVAPRQRERVDSTSRSKIRRQVRMQIQK